jgi:DNA modification methylase
MTLASAQAPRLHHARLPHDSREEEGRAEGMSTHALELAVDRIIEGDALTELQKLPSASADCCITSPPYYGLRDYGVDGQIGLEATPEAYVAAQVAVFGEVKRVLKDEGTLWLNLGDSYAGSWGNSGHRPEIDGTPSHQREKKTEYLARGGWDQRREVPPNQKVAGCKPKDLIGIPWMVAFALRADGWYLRQDIIWAKPAPMPESVRDRCTRSHEYIFLLAKSQKYYYDCEAIAEPLACPGEANRKTPARFGGADKYTEAKKQSRLHSGNEYTGTSNGKRNKRDVWTIPTKPYKEAHFATFPEALVEPCILAGCPEGGTVLDPFFGAGTTGLVAKKLNRSYIGIELNPEYCQIARARVAALPCRLDKWAEKERVEA